MSKRTRHKAKAVTKPARRRAKPKPPAFDSGDEAAVTAERERRLTIFFIIALLILGTYQSILYFGHKVVPIPDFPSIVKVGHELLSFKIPSRFKYAPVVGVLQVCLSSFVNGDNPDLKAGWLLNAILHPFTLVLLFLVGKKITGPAALWFAIIAILNPWILYMLREPLVETTLLFFTLLTVYFIFKRSRWAYLLASITTMVRYEGSALILAAFVMDMIHSSDNRQKIRAFLYSALASVPLMLWMVGVLLSWRSDPTHYLDVLFSKDYSRAFAEPLEKRRGLIMHMNLLWEVGFRPLLLPPGLDREAMQMIWKLNKILAAGTFFFGVFYGLLKRRWELLPLLIFFIPYFILHAIYPYPLQRYHTNIFWIALLISLYGFQSIWKLVNRGERVPRLIILIFQLFSAVVLLSWLISLVGYLPKISPMSPRSSSIPYVAMGLVVVISAARVYIYSVKNLLREVCILLLICLFITSNQFFLVRLLGNGRQDSEFRDLARWFVKNTKPGEKMAVYSVVLTRLFAPNRADDIVGFPPADSPEELTQALYERGVTYVVWASREGLHKTQHTTYRRLNLHKNIDHLKEPRSAGPYEFVTRIGSRGGYINIFRLHKPPGNPQSTLHLKKGPA